MRAAIACLLAAVLLAGCGGAPSPLAGERAASGDADEAVVRAWADDLRRGDVDAATARFAVPALVSNGFPEVRLDTRAKVRAFNASLSCGGRVTQLFHHHGVLIATLMLTERPGGHCEAGTGALAQTAFEVRDGHIVRWLRLPDPAPGPPPASTTET